MPPRFAYWTILIDGRPTAFRAHDQDELLPTLNQLKKTNQDVVLRWFAQGQLWDSPDAARLARQRPHYTPEKRNADWRPGGSHKDPRDRFKKRNRPERAWSDKEPPPGGPRKPWGDQAPGKGAQAFSRAGDRKPWNDKPHDKSGVAPVFRREVVGKPPQGNQPRGGPRHERKPWQDKPRDKSGAAPVFKPAGGTRKPWDKKPPSGAGQSDRPWQVKPTGPRRQRTWRNEPRDKSGAAQAFKPADRERKPWTDKPSSPPRGGHPLGKRPPTDGPGGDRPWQNKPRDRSGAAPIVRPASSARKSWTDKPSGPPRTDRPWSKKPPAGGPRGDHPWQNRPAATGERKRWSPKRADAQRPRPLGPKKPKPPESDDE